MKVRKSNKVTLFQLRVTYSACPFSSDFPVLEGTPRILQRVVWKHSLKSTFLSEPLFWIWGNLGQETFMDFPAVVPFSEGFVPTGKTISLWKHSKKLEVQFQVGTFTLIKPTIYRILPILWGRTALQVFDLCSCTGPTLRRALLLVSCSAVPSWIS